MDVTPLGDSALIVRVSDSLGDDPSATLNQVLHALQRLRAAQIPGVVELAPAYTTIGVYLDPIRVIDAGAPPDAVIDWMSDRIRAALETEAVTSVPPPQGRDIVIPVCYGGEYGPDLEEIARHLRLTLEEVVSLHSAQTYRVHCIGFSPGFPYLGGLPAELTTPRRATPRKTVPAGSVGIAGTQTGIYPFASPGGWNLIGRSPLTLFSVNDDPPSLLRAGDRVRFQPMTPAEFEQWRE